MLLQAAEDNDAVLFTAERWIEHLACRVNIFVNAMQRKVNKRLVSEARPSP
jgi:hypothetical protein